MGRILSTVTIVLALASCVGEASPVSGLDSGPVIPPPSAPDAGPLPPDSLFPPPAPDVVVPPPPPPPPPPTCQVTICLAGAVTRNDGGNPVFGALCGKLPGVVQDCAGKCYPMFDMWGTDKALAALVKALDRNGDGRVDDADPLCDVAIVGYSWGGVNAATLAGKLIADGRVAPSRKVIHKLITIDAYAPGAKVHAVQGVRALWAYRHSASPPTDCSSMAPLGPYKGLQPACHASVSPCLDYDYSLAPGGVFNGVAGKAVGHCSVITAAAAAVQHNVQTGASFAQVPPTVPAQRF